KEVGLAAGHVEGGDVEVEPAVAVHVTPGGPVPPDARGVGEEAGRFTGVDEDEWVGFGMGVFGALLAREQKQPDERGERGRGGEQGTVHGRSLSVGPQSFAARSFAETFRTLYGCRAMM